jgi:hypothetical protein
MERKDCRKILVEELGVFSLIDCTKCKQILEEDNVSNEITMGKFALVKSCVSLMCYTVYICNMLMGNRWRV